MTGDCFALIRRAFRGLLLDGVGHRTGGVAWRGGQCPSRDMHPDRPLGALPPGPASGPCLASKSSLPAMTFLTYIRTWL